MAKLSKAFEAWLNDPLTRPVLPKTSRDGGKFVDFTIATRRTSLSGWVSRTTLMVAAIVDGDCWDFLLSLDVLPVTLDTNTVVCAECPGADRRMFDSVEDLWRDHLFDPLGKWIAEKLVDAEVLAFYQTEGRGATWATLHNNAAAAAGAVRVVVL